MDNLLTFPTDAYLPNADYDTNLKVFYMMFITVLIPKINKN